MKRILVFIGLAVMWQSTRLSWMTASIADDKTGDTTTPISGATWSTELVAAIAIGVIALLASFIRPRIALIIAGLAAIGASWWPLGILAGQPDPARARNLLSGTISDWATVTNLETHSTGPILALVGCALVLIGAVSQAMKKGPERVKSSAYEAKAVRTSKIQSELEENPDSGRVLWDALDQDIDPTDLKEK
ncbi:MAG: TIGR02234 family membrane protein [Corynebacterium sp.]|nr:TIGR02234 family membrane protein [Corynebacterium sp.]